MSKYKIPLLLVLLMLLISAGILLAVVHFDFFDEGGLIMMVGVITGGLFSLFGGYLGWLLSESSKKGKIVIWNAENVQIKCERLETITDPKAVEKYNKEMADRRITPDGDGKSYETIVNAVNLRETTCMVVSFGVIEVFNSSHEKDYIRDIEVVVKGIKTAAKCKVNYVSKIIGHNQISRNLEKYDGCIHGQEVVKLSFSVQFNEASVEKLKSEFLLWCGAIYIHFKDKNGKKHKLRLHRYSDTLKFASDSLASI